MTLMVPFSNSFKKRGTDTLQLKQPITVVAQACTSPNKQLNKQKLQSYCERILMTKKTNSPWSLNDNAINQTSKR